MKSKLLFCSLVMFITIAACNIDKHEIKTVKIGSEENFLVLADTIIDDIVILNPNNDEWTDYSLRNLNKKTLVNEIFRSVYEEELVAYEFFHTKVLSIEDIKKLEDDPAFSRDKIAKVQFEEAWYYDPINQTMVKKVHSIMLAYEIYNSLGEIKGYKPAFKVYLK